MSGSFTIARKSPCMLVPAFRLALNFLSIQAALSSQTWSHVDHSLEDQDTSVLLQTTIKQTKIKQNEPVFIWKCCENEVFINIPGIGLTHLPRSWETFGWAGFVDTCLRLAIIIIALLVVFAFAYLLLQAAIVHSFERKPPRLVLLFLSTSLATYFYTSLLKGVQHITPEWDYPEVDSQLFQKVLQWDSMPGSSPTEVACALNKSLCSWKLPFIAPMFTESEAVAIAARVMSFKDAGWSARIGTPMFFLGVRYSSVFSGGRLIGETLKESLNFINQFDLWTEFDDVWLRYASRCEDLLGSAVHLFRGSDNYTHIPPPITIHMPSFFWTVSAIDPIHTENGYLHRFPIFRKLILSSFKKRHGWRDGVCLFDSMLSFIVPFALPPGGALFDHYTSTGEKSTLRHIVGGAMVFEADRPHRAGRLTEIDGTSPRMTMQMFVVPCFESPNGGNMEWQLIPDSR